MASIRYAAVSTTASNAAPIPAPVISAAEWFIDPVSARHQTGLTIRYERRPKTKKTWLDIEGIQKLAGTPWETQANVLIEQGIALIENGGVAKAPAANAAAATQKSASVFRPAR